MQSRFARLHFARKCNIYCTRQQTIVFGLRKEYGRQHLGNGNSNPFSPSAVAALTDVVSSLLFSIQRGDGRQRKEVVAYVPLSLQQVFAIDRFPPRSLSSRFDGITLWRQSRDESQQPTRERNRFFFLLHRPAGSWTGSHLTVVDSTISGDSTYRSSSDHLGSKVQRTIHPRYWLGKYERRCEKKKKEAGSRRNQTNWLNVRACKIIEFFKEMDKADKKTLGHQRWKEIIPALGFPFAKKELAAAEKHLILSLSLTLWPSLFFFFPFFKADIIRAARPGGGVDKIQTDSSHQRLYPSAGLQETIILTWQK